MAIICMTGFETGDVSIVSSNNAMGVSVTSTRGSWSNYALYANASSDECDLLWDSAVSSFWFGIGVNATDMSGSLNNAAVQFAIGTSVQLSLTWNESTDRIDLYRGNNSTLLSSGTTPISQNVWYYITGNITISDGAGVAQIYINGVLEHNYSGDTKADASLSTVDRFHFNDVSGNDTYFDDIWVTDSSGSANTGNLGDVRIKAYRPNASGDLTELTRGGTDSGSNWGQVDEVPPNTTDYVTGQDTSSRDIYNIPNTSGVANVYGVKLWVYAQKSDAGAANLAHVLKYDSDGNGTADTENTGSDVALSTSWTYHGKTYNTDPAGNPWTAAKIDALQIGVKSR